MSNDTQKMATSLQFLLSQKLMLIAFIGAIVAGVSEKSTDAMAARAAIVAFVLAPATILLTVSALVVNRDRWWKIIALQSAVVAAQLGLLIFQLPTE